MNIKKCLRIGLVHLKMVTFSPHTHGKLKQPIRCPTIPHSPFPVPRSPFPFFQQALLILTQSHTGARVKKSIPKKQMTITPTNTEGAESTATSRIPETDQQFDWQNCWYPVTFIQDFPENRPYPFRLYDQPLVLFRNSSGQLVCLLDRCPHRAAKLSDGQIIDGKLECSYHGWQFGAAGKCLHIPQLPENAKIPVAACAKFFAVVERQGIVWLWAGEAEIAGEECIPTVADLEYPGLFMVDTVVDLPLDATYLIENLVDPAHVVISHDRTQLYAKRGRRPTSRDGNSGQLPMGNPEQISSNPNFQWKLGRS